MQGALSRKKKEEIVAGLKTRLEESMLVFGMPIKGLTVSMLRMPSSRSCLFSCDVS